jgi:hypothetical protein
MVKEIFEKSLKSAHYSYTYLNTNINYRGTYELDFLEKYYLTYPDIVNGPAVKYIFNDKDKVYHPDFYIPSLNLIVEIKSSWTYNPIIDPIKENATIASSYNFIMIINKNYNEFIEKYIKQK